MFIVRMASSCRKYNSLDLGHDLQGPAVDNRDGPAQMGRVLALFSEDHSFMGLENVVRLCRDILFTVSFSVTFSVGSEGRESKVNTLDFVIIAAR